MVVLADTSIDMSCDDSNSHHAPHHIEDDTLEPPGSSHFLPLPPGLDLHVAIMEVAALEAKYQASLSLSMFTRVSTTHICIYITG